jgi:hypothetical protein
VNDEGSQEEAAWTNVFGLGLEAEPND